MVHSLINVGNGPHKFPVSIAFFIVNSLFILDKILTAENKELFRQTSGSRITSGIILKSKARGILKTQWPFKYIEERPALIVCFVDLDWDHPSWPEKRVECG